MKHYLLTMLLAVQGFACLAATDSIPVYVPDAVDELLLQTICNNYLQKGLVLV